ncbi:unnamed protein product [Schistosoma rodhaini]|uniref:Uncharacterized protein n=1 Tax=Schistosoma rodhaini TaxID=6188 RepID=A0AA85F3R4_9TREM|nr:unnamed protein product [Schistosoma rodhaini]
MYTVTQLLGDSNEAKLDIQDIPCINCWNYLMASLILFFGLLLVGFPIPHSDWFLQRLFPISDNYDNPISTESCSIPRSFNIHYISKHLGCLHLVIASGMLYSLSMIKMNGIHVSQLLSSAYSVTFVSDGIYPLKHRIRKIGIAMSSLFSERTFQAVKSQI